MYKCPECNSNMVWNGNTDDGNRSYFQYSCDNCGIELNKYLFGIDIPNDDTALIVEIGRLYKEYNEDWIYGNLENFIKKNFLRIKEYWYGSKREMNCDEVVESWFKENKEEVVR